MTRASACAALCAALASGCALVGRHAPRTAADPSFDASLNRPAKLAVVLSAGTMRGFAHVGVLRELAANGIVPDLIVGSSAGAMVGAIWASGATAAELEAAVEAAGTGTFLDLQTSRRGLFGGEGIHDFVDRHVKLHRIEQFPIRFAAVAVDAERSCLQVFNKGDAGKAVQASATVPVLLAPPRIGGRQYLDGALISPLPVRVARALGAQHVLAVDVSFEPAERSWFNLVEAFWRTSLVTRWALAVSEGREADYLLRPRLPPERSIGLGARRELVEAGAQAVRQHLDAIRAALAAKPLATPGSVHPALAEWTCASALP